MPTAINSVPFLAPITSLHASVLALVYLALSLRVMRLRLIHRQALGDGGHAALTRAVRMHGHFAEYVPLALLLLLLLELAQTPPVVLHGYGLLLLASRLLHLAGLLQTPEPVGWRLATMVLTVNLIGGAALWLVLLWWRG
jgi:uncharacterized membrane protein YecN with MAPEG domain